MLHWDWPLLLTTSMILRPSPFKASLARTLLPKETILYCVYALLTIGSLNSPSVTCCTSLDSLYLISITSLRQHAPGFTRANASYTTDIAVQSLIPERDSLFYLCSRAAVLRACVQPHIYTSVAHTWRVLPPHNPPNQNPRHLQAHSTHYWSDSLNGPLDLLIPSSWRGSQLNICSQLLVVETVSRGTYYSHL